MCSLNICEKVHFVFNWHLKTGNMAAHEYIQKEYLSLKQNTPKSYFCFITGNCAKIKSLT